MRSFAFTLTAIAALTSVVVALPSIEISKARSYPEIIPGRGLPSLESLGLTSADLYERGMPALARGNDGLDLESFSLAKRAATCETFSVAPLNDVMACFNFLNSIGTHSCSVNGDNALFCHAGQAVITGSNVSGTGNAASLCSDVALGLKAILATCNVGGQVGGNNAANGNGFLTVGVENAN